MSDMTGRLSMLGALVNICITIFLHFNVNHSFGNYNILEKKKWPDIRAKRGVALCELKREVHGCLKVGSLILWQKETYIRTALF